MKVDYEEYWKHRIREGSIGLMPRHYAITTIIKQARISGSVLDLGCGEGYILKMLPDTFEKYGCDISDNALELINDSNIIISKSDINRGFPFDRKFDIIICSEVLEHLEKPSIVLENVKRHLIEDGLFLVTIPNVRRLDHRIKKILGLRPDYDRTHINFWNLEDFFNLLRNQGYRIVEFFPTYYPLVIRLGSYVTYQLNKSLRNVFHSNFKPLVESLYKFLGEQFLFVCKIDQ